MVIRKGIAAILTTITLTVAPSFAAASSHLRRVVLHITDYTQTPHNELDEAQRAASEVYARLGVELVWTDGHAVQAPADDALHLDVVILTAAMTAQRKPQPAPLAFGQAAHLTRYAFIYGPRITEHAIQTRSDPARVLALVLAHEIGHMLLPEYSHTATGLMRARWDGRVLVIPDFLPSQAAAIRTELASN
jgi:hypothetical protein